MAEVLKEWLTERLQRPIKWINEEFGNMMKDGYIIANVLLSYHIINEEKFFLIRSTINPEEIKTNWKHLREWLKELQVILSDQDLISMMEGKGSMLLRLFYVLFLYLDKKDRTDFIKRERTMVSTLVDKLENRFKVERVVEKDESFVDDLSRPLLNEKQFIEWQRKKSAKVKDTYDYIRHKYSKMLDKIHESKAKLQYTSPCRKITQKEKIEMDKFSKLHPCEFKNYTYEQLLELEQKANERKKSIVDTESAKNYMDNLFTKIHKRSESEEFHKEVRNNLTNSLWEFSVGEEEEKLDTDYAKKVMKLSQFEKQMCTQLMETKQQARNLFQNRAHAEREFADQRKQQFNQYLDNVKEQIHLEVVEIDFERQRQNMLHKKLYAEKNKRKRQHYYEICYETVLSIIDYATKYAYYQRLLEDDIPNHFIHEWKNLYYKQQPIFDILEPTEKLLKDNNLEEEVAPEEEEIIRLELDRQNALNESEFLEYHNYAYPWTLDFLIPNYDPESEDRKYEYLGTRILGHVVYTLLEIKYPYPPAKLPADLPNFPVKALVRDLPDKSMTSAMQTLLSYKKVHVTRIESAIYFCLKRFKTELIGSTDIELSFDKFTAVAQSEEDREILKKIKMEDEIAIKTIELAVGPLPPSPPNTKQTQTPKTLPEEEIVLSTAAELGRYAYQALGSGEPLTDHLISAMIVEYLKGLQNINGFVIINYPNSYREAQVLEESFSGCEPPDETKLDDRDEIYLEESIKRHRKKEKDQYKDIRVSKLVSDPHIKKADKQFESYFNCYIRLKPTEDILQELVIWNLTEENSELIDRFYASLGINYSMYYEIIDKELLAQICKYIIGDYTLPLKSCDRLFGENVLSELEFPATDDKRIKSKIVKPEINDGKSKHNFRRNSKSKNSFDNPTEIFKQSSSPDVGTDTETVVIMEELSGEENESQSFISHEEIKLLAGEEDWEYGHIPIAEIIGVALATCWEEIEKTYIHDMEQLFLAKRLQMNCLVPYARFIKDKMEQIITLPSIKQDLVSAFQKEYNDFENDWRYINLTKNEWHCKVKELQHKLYTICDERKLRAQQQRQAMICENWAMEELTTMVNVFISCMQTELNRSVLTFQILHDFYYAMIKRMPPNDRLSSKDLTKILREVEDSLGSKKGGEDKVFKQLRTAFQELQLKNVEIDYNNNPFNLFIENNVKFALKVIKDVNDSYRSLISREYSEIAKIIPVPKRKDDNTSEDSANVEEIFKENGLKCIEEWTVGINGEMFRASQRILALQYKCYHDMKLFNDHIYKTFMDVQNNINSYYLNEIKSVDRLSKYLQMAVEDGRKIKETLILEYDSFVIDPNLVQFPPPEPAGEKLDLIEFVNEWEFKIGQLARLRSQLQIVAPSGLILQKKMIYLLQDFIIFGKESCEGSMFPEDWKRVDPEQIPKLVYNLYGDTVYVDWRDFLIYCLNIRFPSIDVLLDLRKKFRCNDLDSTELISRDDFMAEELWFEQYFDPESKQATLRNNLTKHFVFKLFETAHDVMNYPAFLLAFCKSIDTIEGFASALSMSLGIKMCFSLQECQAVITEQIRLKKYKDACLACALKCTNQFLEKVITNVINICDGTSITELAYGPLPDVDKKGKKSKAAMSKTKSITSARSQKSQKTAAPSQHKNAQSTTEVTTTFICRPCEDEAEVVDVKPQDKEELEEEQKHEPQADPNLAYAVPQNVIWNVLRTCLPWHFELLPEAKKTPYVEQVTDVMKRLQVDTDNGDIYVSKFVSDSNVCRMLHKVKKFTILDIAEEVRNVFKH